MVRAVLQEPAGSPAALLCCAGVFVRPRGCAARCVLPSCPRSLPPRGAPQTDCRPLQVRCRCCHCFDAMAVLLGAERWQRPLLR